LSQGERRLAAIMFTDMVGYAALTQSNESLAMEALETHNRLLRPFFPRFHGKEVKAIGDSFLVEFESALDAMKCASEIQTSLHDYNVSSKDQWKLSLRIGVHLGDVIHQANDVFGDAVNIASRIEPLAEPEGICLTREVYEQVKNKFDLPLVALGAKNLKNIGSKVEVYKVSMPWQDKKAISSGQLESSRIAVLPFANMSPDPEDEYFADGMTEELISTVSKIEGIEVISRTSVMQYKKTPKPIKDLAQELAVGIILEGSVRKAGNKLRVAVQMIDATKDRHLWAENYDRDFQDIFAIQRDIANRVAEAMKARISGTGSRAMISQSTSSLEAYTLYLRAMQLSHEGGEPALKEAISNFERAISKDPEFARAYAGLAEVWLSMVGAGYEDFAPGLGKAEAAALRAVELGPESAEAHAAMADVHVYMDRFKESISEAERAIKIDPNLSDAYLSLGMCYASIGTEQALVNFQRACDLDPLSYRAKTLLAESLRVGRRESEALDVLEKLRDLYPRNARMYTSIAECYLQKGDFEKAQEALSIGLRFSPEEPLLKVDQGLLYALSGKTREAEGELEIIMRDKRESVRLRGRIRIQMGLGNIDEAFAALMRAAETHSWWTWTTTDPLYESLQKDPRFPQFCLKVGLPG